MVIDFHTHTFPEKLAARAIPKLSGNAGICPFSDATNKGLTASMKKNHVDYSVTLPVVTSPEQVEKINHPLLSSLEYLNSQGIIPFGGIHPDYASYRTELRLLKEKGIRGIKLHPAFQGPDLDDIRYLRIIDAASEEGLIVLTHGGIDIGICDHNYASVKAILSVIEQVHPEKFVVAHMGNWGCWEETEEYLCGAPVWFDTAFSLGKIALRPDIDHVPYQDENLSDDQFIRLVHKHGADHILFGTDSPWEDQGEDQAHIHALCLTESDEKLILGENAGKLLGL